ncbi:MAG TPA: ABC transporter substrate-binding protein [Candidatus Acidoferrum sp.]|nr:ABC transporter substrate-binding protein [Candidatus Acidoferrum sp.]
MKPRALRNLAVVMLLAAAPLALGQSGGVLHFCLHGEPKTFNPILVDDEASENIRYLTGGVLIRLNRQTQALEPGLAESWHVSKDGRTITFRLRKGLHFSDGTAFTSEDVGYTMKTLMDPQVHSPTGDAFRSGEGAIDVQTPTPDVVTITFPASVAGLERLFDQVAILSVHSPQKEMAVLGPFYVSEYKAGLYVELKRNPNYWRRDAQGHPLPYLDGIRLDIQRNRDIELLRFRRGELQLINRLDAESYQHLQKDDPNVARNAGAGLDSDHIWFNEVPSAPLAEYKKAWFRTTEFRKAVSLAINRDDICRIVFAGYAKPAYGPVSPANRFWFNAALPAPKYDPQGALRLLIQAGFRFANDELRDKAGNRVEFTLVTNSGNTVREKMAAMIQQDLSQIGIKVSVVTLDFPSLIERMTRTFDYEACLLGLVNTDLDPSGVMTVWLSSGENHQWNPNQKNPATPWEAEMDKLMREQASAIADKDRKKKFDRVQQIIYEQQPFIYLVNRDVLTAVSPAVVGVAPTVLNPQAFWNADVLQLGPAPQLGAQK